MKSSKLGFKGEVLCYRKVLNSYTGYSDSFLVLKNVRDICRDDFLGEVSFKVGKVINNAGLTEGDVVTFTAKREGNRLTYPNSFSVIDTTITNSSTSIRESDESSVVKEDIKWSEYQLAIFEHVATKKSENILINAKAGSGKTFTLKHLVIKILEKDASKKVLMLAFNVHIAKELREK